MKRLHVVFTLFLALITARSEAAIFDDGNDRKPIRQLLAKPDLVPDPGLRNALISASDSVGRVVACGGTNYATGFFVKFAGRPAFMTSGHSVARLFGLHICEGQNDKSVRIYKSKSGKITQTEVPYVDVQINPELYTFSDNAKFQRDGRDIDISVYFLSNPNEEVKYLELSSQSLNRYARVKHGEMQDMVVLGLAPDIGHHKEVYFQKDCINTRSSMWPTLGVYTSCDVVKGTSGSVMGLFEDGKIKVFGLFNAEYGHNLVEDGIKKLERDHLGAVKDYELNAGMSIDRIRDFEKVDRSALLAYELQWLLLKAKCYGGPTDNKWGRASKKAAVEFAELYGLAISVDEPTSELLDSFENVSREQNKSCDSKKAGE